MSEFYVPETAMFVFAHPDDIEFGVAGTAARWAATGSRVLYVILTDGNVGSHEANMTPERLVAVSQAKASFHSAGRYPSRSAGTRFQCNRIQAKDKASQTL